MRRAVKSGAHLLHTSEASLSGYVGIHLSSLDGYDWELPRRETSASRGLANAAGMPYVSISNGFSDKTGFDQSQASQM